MNKKTGVLIFPAGEINSIELHDALCSCVNINLYGASSVDRHGGYIFTNYISGIPFINDETFIERFNEIIENNSIDVIFPTHDDVSEFLIKNQNIINAKILGASDETAEVCRDKKKIYELFAECDFCPKVYLGDYVFPVYIKPRRGQGGKNARLAKVHKDIPDDIDNFVFCEYLPGVEYTVDCFTDKDKKLQAVLPRSRKRIFGGVSVSGEVVELTDEIKAIAKTINARLNFLGLWYFQIKKDSENRFKLLEISARCAGSMCLSRALGVNLPLLSVYAALDKKTEIIKNAYSVAMDRTLISRYKMDLEYDKVYIDLDGTIIINGKVNLQAIRFLFQCSNDGKRVFLLTRHNSDHADSAEDALARCKIPPALFEKIIHIGADEPKTTAIDPDNAIFIDNAFAERKAVYERLNIPVFDVDGIEVLLDWRA